MLYVYEADVNVMWCAHYVYLSVFDCLLLLNGARNKMNEQRFQSEINFSVSVDRERLVS